MENFKETLVRSYNRYQDLYTKTVAAVNYAEKNNHEAVATAVSDFTVIQKDIQDIDQTLAALTSQVLISANIKLWNERRDLMQKIMDHNNNLLPQLHSVLAMQRSEIEGVKRGMRGISGYQSGSTHTGKNIKNSF